MRHTISILVENKFGVLARVAGMFSGRGFNIETLNVAPTDLDGNSRITATLMGGDDALDQALKQLKRLVNVLDVVHYTGDEAVSRELIMLKVKATSENRSEISQIVEVFRAKIVSVTPGFMIVEVTGNNNKLKAFMEMISIFGVLEIARTGNVALPRNSS